MRDIPCSQNTDIATFFLPLTRGVCFLTIFLLTIFSAFCTHPRFSLWHIYSLFLYIWHFWKKFAISALQTLYFITTFLFPLCGFLVVTIVFKVPGVNFICLILSKIIFWLPTNISMRNPWFIFLQTMSPALNPFHMAFLICVFALCPLIRRSSKTSRGWH